MFAMDVTLVVGGGQSHLVPSQSLVVSISFGALAIIGNGHFNLVPPQSLVVMLLILFWFGQPLLVLLSCDQL
jgi:hypothetical protein